MKIMFFLLACLISFNLNAAIPGNTALVTPVPDAAPRYIFSERLAHLESIAITPDQVHIGDSIQFDLNLIGLNSLNVDIYYVISESDQVFLTRLDNLGNGRYTGSYPIPEVEFGTYTQFRGIATSADRAQELFTGVFPGVSVVPRPDFIAEANPTSVIIGDTLRFTAETIGFKADSVDVVYDLDGQHIPISTLSLTEQSPFRQFFEGEFMIPGGVPAGEYNAFQALATQQGSGIVQQALISETVILDTNCATAEVLVRDDSGEPVSDATATIGDITGVSDDQGNVTLSGLEDNTQQMLTVTASDFIANQQTVDLSCLNAAQASVILEPTLKDCAQLTVNVSENSSGEIIPVSGATVTTASQSSVSDTSGVANFTDLLEGVHTMTTSAEQFVQDQREISLSCDTPTVENVTLEPIIENCATVDVLVSNLQEQAIAGAQVTIGEQTGITDATGQLTLTNIREDATQVDVSAPGYGPLQSQISLDCIEPISVSYTLDQCADVEFNVFILDGTEQFPVFEALVVVTDTNAERFEATTGDDGVVSFGQLNPGSHDYTVTRQGLAPVNSAFAIESCRSSPSEIFHIDVPMTSAASQGPTF